MVALPSAFSSDLSEAREDRRRVARRRWEVPRSVSTDGAVSDAPRRVVRVSESSFVPAADSVLSASDGDSFSAAARVLLVLVRVDLAAESPLRRVRVRRGFSAPAVISSDIVSSVFGSAALGSSTLGVSALAALRRRPIGGRGRSDASASEVMTEPPVPAAVIVTEALSVSPWTGAPAGRDATRRRREAGISAVEFSSEFNVVLSVSSSIVLSLAFRHGQCPPGYGPAKILPQTCANASRCTDGVIPGMGQKLSVSPRVPRGRLSASR